MNIKDFEHQVAGHARTLFVLEPATFSGLDHHHHQHHRQCKSILAKPVPGPESIEVQFYTKLSLCPSLAAFAPSFLGVRECTLPGRATRDWCVLMENVVDSLANPSIVDVKIGTRLYGRDASEAKRMRMEEQARVTTSGEMGLRICGMKLFNPISETYTIHGKEFGRSLTPSTLGSGFKEFFQHIRNSSLRQTILSEFICKTQELISVLKQAECRIYAASILLAFDAQGHTIVKLIDFAHSHFCPGEGHDESAIFGLETLIRILEKIQLENAMDIY
ncbi:SAICAR synthase-like protein [Rhizoclosmatium globosum]|uniref:Kinase n=1 Tax=Rhizoclosmatium globosum TaxID=329046 RepID=A0A1Y2BYM4_9FUNG|nr:SAICAR synthase-like protein [Rhizoclosmatium globosum]|eukprot:ORY39165.1 SAICAR synthase-like protein [Rhizoclosmatium globosum]